MEFDEKLALAVHLASPHVALDSPHAQPTHMTKLVANRIVQCFQAIEIAEQLLRANVGTEPPSA